MTTNTLTATRRAILAAVPATAAIAAVPAVAASNPDAIILAAWERRNSALARNADLPIDVEKSEEGRTQTSAIWSEIDAAEEVIRASTARTAEGVAVQLWVAMAHSVIDRESDVAMARRDLEYMVRHEGDMEWHERLVLSALRSLEAMEA